MRKKTNRLIKFLLLVFFIVIFIYLLYNFNNPILEISTTPTSSVITIDNSIKYNGYAKLRLKKGVHKINISSPNYFDVNREVSLQKNVKLTINLVKKINFQKLRSEVIDSIPAHTLTNISVVSNTSLLALDRKSGKVIRLHDDSIITMSNITARDYTASSSFLIILPYQNNNSLNLVNLNNNASTLLSSNNINNIVDVDIDPNSNLLFLIANHDPIKRISEIFKTSIEPFNPILVTTSQATSIEAINNNLVLLYNPIDGANNSYFVLFNTIQRKELFRTKAENYIISPDNKTIAYKTYNGISFVNTDNFKTKNKILEGNIKYHWIDNSSLVILKNLSPGVEIFIIDTNNLQSSQPVEINSLENNSVRFIEGIVDNYVYITDMNGRIIKLTLPILRDN